MVQQYFSYIVASVLQVEEKICSHHNIHVAEILQKLELNFNKSIGGCHGRDCMVVGFTTTYAINTYHH